MDVKEPDRGFPRAAHLYGTATVSFRDRRKKEHSLPADQTNMPKQKAKKSRGGRLKLKGLVRKCFPCLRGTESYTPEDTSAPDADKGNMQVSDARLCTQDHEKDVHYKHLIPKTGSTRYLPNSNLVSANLINVSVRNGQEQIAIADQQDTLPTVHSSTDTVMPAVMHRPNRGEIECLSESLHQHFQSRFVPKETPQRYRVRGASTQTEVVVEAHRDRNAASTADDTDCDEGTQRKGVEADQQQIGGSEVTNLKSVLGAVSAQMKAAYGQGDNQRTSLSVRDRHFTGLQTQKSFPHKEWLMFRYAPTLRNNMIQMMHSTDDGNRQREEEGATTSGGDSGFRFSTPVQVTDDQPPPVPHFLTGQESVPAAHQGIAAARLTLDPSYSASLVTNSSRVPSDEPSGYQALMGQMARAQVGQLNMRHNVPNPLGADHNVENLPHALDFVHEFDQLNMDGEGQTSHRPHFAQFGLPNLRLPTFLQGWPADHSQEPASLVDAGFFYGGYGDSVLCYSCGIGLRHWEAGDHPWIEHARLRPSCVLVNTVQGQEFIDVAKEMTRNGGKPTYEQVRLEANRRRQAAQAGSGETESPQINYNDETTVALMCKICYRRERTVMLNPCQHIAVCEPCALLIMGCPTCRGHVDTFQAVA